MLRLLHLLACTGLTLSLAGCATDYQMDLEQELQRLPTSEANKFPLRPPAYALIRHSEFYQPTERFVGNELQQLIRTLQDSAIYSKGELDMTRPDRWLSFFDAQNRCVGIMRVSYDGQTYAVPSPTWMKDGSLTSNGLNRLISRLKNTH